MQSYYFLSLFLLCFIAVVSCEKHYERKITHHQVYQIECMNETLSGNYSIVHMIATRTDKPLDNLHYVFTAIGRPTIFIKHFLSDKGELTINKTNICFQNGSSFSFHPNNSDVSGIIVDSVFPFDDANDAVSLEGLSEDDIGEDIAQHFNWEYKHSNDLSQGKAAFKSSSDKINGSLDFSVDVRLSTKNTKEAPSNPVHANLTQFRLDMKDLPTNFSDHTRYAVRLIFFSSGEKNGAGSFTSKKYIDDEYTPGNFQMWSVHFPLQYESNYLFSAWKPVSYVSADRNRETQSLVKNFDESGRLPSKGNLDLLKKKLSTWTIANHIDGMHFYDMNITYGLAKDGCYNNKPYMSWTGMLGYYKSPVDEISTLVIVIISVGIGAPALLILAGIFVLLVRKVRLKGKTYEQIN